MAEATTWHIAVYQGIRRAPVVHAFTATIYVPHLDNEKRMKGFHEALPVRFTGKTADEAETKARKHWTDAIAKAGRMRDKSQATENKGGKPESWEYNEALLSAIQEWRDAFVETTEELETP